MEISSINAVNSTGAAAKSEAVEELDNSYEFFTPSDRLDRENLEKSRYTKQEVLKNLKELKSKITLHDDWYHFIIGNDHIEIKGDGKLTYGDLRAKFGIPPRALSQTNHGNFKDADVVKGTVTINLEDMGWFERSMDSMEAEDARNQRNYGNYFAGWERALTNEDIIKLLSD